MSNVTPDNPAGRIDGTGRIERIGAWYRAAKRVSAIAAVFSTVVFLLLVANAVSSRRLDPAKPVRLDSLQIELNKDRNNEKLRAEVQRLDRDIRTSYFRGRAFASSGLYMLLGGIAVFLLSLEAANRLRRRLPDPRAAASREYWLGYATANRSVVGLGTALGGLLLVLVVLSRHDAGAEYARAATRPAGPREPGKIQDAGHEGHAMGGPAAVAGAMGPGPAGLTAGQGGSSFAPLVPAPASGGTPPPLASSGGTALGSSGSSAAPSGVMVRPLPVIGTKPSGGKTAAPPIAPAARRGSLAGAAHAAGWEAGWPVFRGPSGTGAASGEAPVSWDGASGKSILWKADVPLPGWNSPIVWGDRLFVAGGDKTQREVYCYNADTGALLWRKQVPLPKPAPVIKVSHDTGYAPSTMATDGTRVCAIFPTGDLACFDFDGKLLWQRSLGAPTNTFGHGSSLTIYANGLIVPFDQGHADDAKSSLLALNVETGETIWEAKRTVASSWSTPVLVKAGERDLLVTCADPWVIAYDPRTGEEVWKASCLRGDVVPSAITASGLVMACMSGSDLVAIRPELSGDITKAGIAWTYPDDLPDIASPVSDGERIYMTADSGFLTCIDAKTGKKLWDQDLRTAFHASPIVAGGKVYLTDTEGVTYVFEAASAFKQVAKNALGEKVSASPAVVGGRIYLRGEKRLYCIGAK